MLIPHVVGVFVRQQDRLHRPLLGPIAVHVDGVIHVAITFQAEEVFGAIVFAEVRPRPLGAQSRSLAGYV